LHIHEESPYTTPLHNTPDKLVLGHTGYTGTLLWVDKKDKLYFVFLTNRVYPDDATRKGKPTISTVRQDIAAEMLKSQPGYGKYLVGKKRKK
jgi:CubicO group peptidase (beta-lactamase class C family)